MALAKLEVYIPEKLLETLGPTTQEAEQRVLEHVVLSMVQHSQISLRYGADVLRLTYQEMLQLMGENDVPVVNYDVEDFEKEVKTLDKLLG